MGVAVATRMSWTDFRGEERPGADLSGSRRKGERLMLGEEAKKGMRWARGMAWQEAMKEAPDFWPIEESSAVPSRMARGKASDGSA